MYADNGAAVFYGIIERGDIETLRRSISEDFIGRNV